MTSKSLSLLSNATTEMKDDEEIEKIRQPAPSFSRLPEVVLDHLVPFLKWSSRRSLSQVNSRFRGHFLPFLVEGNSLSVKGQVFVDVGDRNQQTVSFLSEFYTIRCEMDDEIAVEWTLKMESGMRTVVHTHYDRDVEKSKTESILISSSDYLKKKLKWILEKYRFKRIHLGVPGLSHLFNSYNHKIHEIGVSDEVEYLQLAERLCPKKLVLFQPMQLGSKRGKFNLKKFPQLEELRLYGVALDLDQLVESKVVKVQADTLENDIKLKHAKKIIQNWKSGRLNYKEIQISCGPYRIPTRVPYNFWSDLSDESTDGYYDNVVNAHHKTGSFRYSSRTLLFVPWDDGIEPSLWCF
uniref:F-box domain-containing protein n=2 Tax=Caenorhabditis tropicalis TaxID=1561998 RepID=A0A1I7UIT8_9PELO